MDRLEEEATASEKNGRNVRKRREESRKNREE
jgi:hypothetical protein